MRKMVSRIMAVLLIFAFLPSLVRADEMGPQETVFETNEEETTAPTEAELPIYENGQIEFTLASGDLLVDGTDDSYEYPQIIFNGETKMGTVDTTVQFVNGVATADQNDYYRFSLSIRSNVTIRVSSNYPLYSVVLWDGNGFNIANGTVITKQLSAGTYTVSIQNRPKTGTNSYAISLSYCEHGGAEITMIEPATCTDDGYAMYDCPSCGDVWTQSTPAKGHNYGSWTVISNSTCTENGTKARYCARCNGEETEQISPTGHTLGAWMETRAATCEKEGRISAWCSVCGEEEVSKTPALGHEYGDWEVTREPTCSLEGVNAKTCIRCSAKISESIPVVEHTFGEWVVTKKATCKTEGSRIRFCPVCGISETEVFTSPHNYKLVALVKLLDNGNALYTVKCDNCGTSDQDEARCIFTYGSYSYGSIAEGTIRIGDSAFEGTNLESIHIPDSVTSIGKAAFKNTELTSITIPKGVTEIQEETFAYCYNLSKVTFPAVFLRNYGPEGVTSIGQRAFASCYNLTSIVLPQRLETVGKEAFSGTGLRKIVLPQSVTSLGSRAFPDTLQKITFSGHAPKYPSYNRPYDQPFGNCTADAYYPAGKWSSSAQDGVGMNLNWIACEHPNKTPSSCTFPYICNDCGAMGYYRASHTATDATCTEPSVCTTCENVVKNALGHVFETYVPNNDRTCTANGTETAKCTRCDATHTRDIPGTLLGHSFGDHVPNGDGKCYVDGTKTAKCRRCDAVNIVTDPGSITEHSIVIVEGKAPTCLEMGLTDGEYCSICGAVTEEQYIIGTSDHSYTDDKDTTCNVCGETRELSVPMHRMYDPNSGEHFYTGAEAERDFLVSAGWHYEGVGFNFPVEGAPVHRLYDPVHGEHLYTMNKQEMNKLLDKGWQYEGVAFNSAGSDEVPQYRLHNPNAKRGGYHFTGSTEERDLLISFGWIDQGIGWYSCLE